MQAPQPVQATPAQIQLQIENTHWQEKEQTIQNNWSRVESERQQQLDHEHYMVDHLATPIMWVCIAAIICMAFVYGWRLSMQSDVQEANRLLAEARREPIGQDDAA